MIQNWEGELVVFALDHQLHGLPIKQVDRVYRIFEIRSAASDAPALLGVADIQGWIVPVFNTRYLLGLPGRDFELSDQVIQVKTRNGPAALWVDEGTHILKPPPDSRAEAGELPGNPLPKSTVAVLRHSAGLVFIHDLEVLLNATLEPPMAGMPIREIGHK